MMIKTENRELRNTEFRNDKALDHETRYKGTNKGCASRKENTTKCKKKELMIEMTISPQKTK